jgi:exopolyphosphatase / guanosine-5'-triphosphate,3'-diphosphate pyrophosphatase
VTSTGHDDRYDGREREFVARDLEPMGVIDIGSNSVRLVVYEGAQRSPTPIFNEKSLAGLGRSIATSGRLSDDAVEKSLTALKRFRAVVRVLGVKNIRAVATAACRDASNGPDFIARAQDISGVKIEILTGHQEAEYAANGIVMGFSNPDGIAGDLGGGSLEVIDLAGTTLRQSATTPLGGLRLLDTSGGKIDRALEITDTELARVPWLNKGQGRSFFAVGGTWRSLAKLHMEQTNYPLRVMHGYAVPAKEMIEFCEQIRKAKKLSALAGIEEIARARREMLPYGALVLERLLKLMKPREVVFSVFGVREGLLYKLLSPQERALDPLLSFAADYARLRSRSLRHAYELCDWTDALFAEPGPKETPDERRLRHAACLLSDIGWRAHPDYRGEQSLNVIAHAALAGIDHPGRVFLAMAIFYRHAGSDDEERVAGALSDRLKAIGTNRLLKRARITGAAIRAAHMLSIGRPGIIDETVLSYERDALVMTVPQAYAALDGERLRRRFGVVGQLLDRKADVRFVA